MLLLQDVQRHIRTQQMAGTMAMAMGAQVELPDEYQLRADFDEQLRADPQRDESDPDRMTMLRALGLRD